MIFSGLFKIHFVISYSVFPYEVAIVFHPLGFFLITVIVILDLLYFAYFTVSCIFFLASKNLTNTGLASGKSFTLAQRHGFTEFLTTTVGLQNIRSILTCYISSVLLTLGFVYIGQKPEQYVVGAVSCPSATPGDQHSFRAM